jgi:hypothetical protein
MYLFFRLSKMINCFPGSFSSFEDDEIDEEEDDWERELTNCLLGTNGLRSNSFWCRIGFGVFLDFNKRNRN